MPSLLPNVDPHGLLEYSVVYSDRAVNHMSQRFQGVMTDISTALKQVYGADAVAVVPGSGTFGMEAVARQFATGRDCLVIRNGWFSYRWTQILDAGAIPSSSTVLKAKPVTGGATPSFAPPPLESVVEAIGTSQPDLVFAAHVETAAGILLPDDYIARVAEATHAAGGLFVLDCIASGALWIDMAALGVDLLISAPQKGWSGSPCCGLVMLSAEACERMNETTSTSFACDLRRWTEIMQAYENGGHAYHATMPTDGLTIFRDAMNEAATRGFAELRAAQQTLGARVRAVLAEKNLKSVAAPGYEAPSVVVSYTSDPALVKRLAGAGVQTAAGVPLQCDEPQPFQTFRIGLFGLDKLNDIDRTVAALECALGEVV